MNINREQPMANINNFKPPTHVQTSDGGMYEITTGRYRAGTGRDVWGFRYRNISREPSKTASRFAPPNDDRWFHFNIRTYERVEETQ